MKFAPVTVILSLVCLVSGCDYFSEEPTTYQVVAMRHPGVVTTSRDSGEPGQSALGKQLVLGNALTWIDGETHDDWESAGVATFPLGRSDPMFGDVYWQPDEVSSHIHTVRYLAGEEKVGMVIYVDTQVALISAPAGAPVYVLEKRLSEDTALQLETALQDRKFNPGPVDGVIDAETRRALGLYYDSLGLTYRFKTPVISSALLHELLGEMPDED